MTPDPLRPVRRLVFLAVLCASPLAAQEPVPAKPAPEPAMDAVTIEKLKEALDCVNLSVEDLGWNKRPIDDGFRLACVNETLDAPLTLADRCERAEREFGGDPEAAVVAGADWLDLPTPASRGAELAELPEEVPGTARVWLATLVAAARAADAARDRMFAGLSAEEMALLRRNGHRLYTDESEDEWDMTAVLAAAKKVDVAEAFAAARALAAAAKKLLAEPLPEAAGWRGTTWNLDGLVVMIGGADDDRYRGADIVLDAGGNDLYTDCRIVVDLGGDDTYRDCAGGLFATGLILDREGNDRYLGRDITQGGAAFGASILVDAAGDDRYEARQCSQGSGFFGVGILIDLAGNDAYRGGRFVQGFGGTRGLGVLSDVSGADTYYAGGVFTHAPLLPEHHQALSQGFGFGLRGANTSGGVGILADHAGNDVYFGEVFAQGCSYWFALGLLIDSAGHDRYECYRYGQGSGIHLSPAALFDRAGDDAYTCNTGVAQGCGHDWGVGLLLDLAGDDYYTGAGMTQGGANANGLGICIDRRGNDSYSGTHPQIQGFSFQSRGSFGLGILLDLGGADRYTGGGEDNRTWTKSTLGVGLDWEEKK